MNTEFHIASFIVLARPGRLPTLCEQLQQLPGTEVHQRDSSGKAIITVEAASTYAINQVTLAIGQLDGVLACNMVFHQFEPATEEAPHEH
jgi:nitrate reductase NapD